MEDVYRMASSGGSAKTVGKGSVDPTLESLVNKNKLEISTMEHCWPEFSKP